MQKIYDEVATLDRRCYERFGLSEEILMEHAADGIADFIRARFTKGARILAVCGSGNNGADVLVLARLLHGDYDVKILYAKEPKSAMAKLQAKRARLLDIPTCDAIEPCDIVVDGIVGTGFRGAFSEAIGTIVDAINASDAYVVACDVPSGYKVRADATLTMGALKKEMFLDGHKDYVGEIAVLDLGVSRDIYELDTNWMLADDNDFTPPNRVEKNTHKGSFGHLCVVSGEKSGAATLCASAALRFGSGLVTLLSNENIRIPYELMQAHTLPANASAVALGMGLGSEYSQQELESFLDNSLPLLLDADIFSHPLLPTLMRRDNIVLTPHPKEFTTLLSRCDIADIDTATLQRERFSYVERFTQRYPNATLLLKGANMIIARNGRFFINPHGSAKLAKGGSGDVLGGLVGALLAQGFSPLEAALQGSLALTRAAAIYTGNDFAMTPNDVIANLKDI